MKNLVHEEDMAVISIGNDTLKAIEVFLEIVYFKAQERPTNLHCNLYAPKTFVEKQVWMKMNSTSYHPQVQPPRQVGGSVRRNGQQNNKTPN